MRGVQKKGGVFTGNKVLVKTCLTRQQVRLHGWSTITAGTTDSLFLEFKEFEFIAMCLAACNLLCLVMYE